MPNIIKRADGNHNLRGIFLTVCIMLLLPGGRPSMAFISPPSYLSFTSSPIITQPTTAYKKPQHSYHQTKFTHNHYLMMQSSPSSEFPQQDYPEEENDGREEGNGSSFFGGGFDRGEYKQRGVGAVPVDRQLIRRGTMLHEDYGDDEFEGYMNMDDDKWEDSIIAIEGSVEGGPVDKVNKDYQNYEQGGESNQNEEKSRPPAMEKLNYLSGEVAGEEAIREQQRKGPFRRRAEHYVPTMNHTEDINEVMLNNSRDAKADQINRAASQEGYHDKEELPTVNDFRNQFTTTSKTTNESTPQNKQQERKTPRRRGRITTEQINAIKSSISLVDVIETYNLPSFSRSNNHYSHSTAKACCPFHDDNNPSLSIDDSRGLYMCFACGAGGDVFNFIREYDFLDKREGEEKMGYMAAVEYAAREFGDGEWNYSSGGDGKFEGMSEERIEKMKERERRKERMRQANTAAAAFYTKCLVTLPTAGKARSHLRSRNISPQSIRAFALGYAPDCYYGDEVDKRRRKWGEGSLVEYLADVGFAPDEIVEAGLAVRTRKKQLNNKNDTTERKRDGEDLSNNAGNETCTSDEDDADVEHDYSDLMDRFRSRLIIPIMDETGRNVIALGGRHLEPTASNDDNNKNDEFSRPAKYINSPESLVFTKKNVLFNRHGARLALSETISSRDDNVDSSGPATFDAPPAPSVIIVEGYFDAIALANVGVSNVVASMGTALPLEQLNIAVQLLGVPGRIILCMDGDDAGTNAVERLCSGGNVLSKVPELNRNELHVATLSSDVGVKDPSDYVDFAGGGMKAGERFQEEVIDSAMPWDEWYVARILSRHQDDVVNAAKDGSSNESFSDLCDEISTFLATFPNPADRTRRAHKVAETLAGLIVAQDDLAGSSLGMLRVQLESDILNMSSRKAGVREAMERRIESTEGISGEAVASKMERLTAGGGLEEDDDDDGKMTKNTLLSRANMPRRKEEMTRASRPPPGSVATQNDRTSARRSFRPRQPPEERHLVPHFNGFTFKHQSDRDWLGLPRNGKKKPKMHLGETPSPVDERDRLRAETPMFESNKNIFARRKKEDAVYFNSNQYLGQQYLSPDAVRAGYELDETDRPTPGESIVDFMNNKLFDSTDPDRLIYQAESRLLHALAKFPQARAAMRTVYSSTSAFGPSNMRWTSEEREWLFLCLSGSMEIDPLVPVELLEGGTFDQLRLYLASRVDCPDGAFGAVKESETNHDATSYQDGIIETDVESSSSDGHEQFSTISTGDDNSNVEVIGLDDNGDGLDSSLEQSSSQQARTQGETTVAKSGHATIGLLDEFFMEIADMFPTLTNSTIARETRAELTVQETVATLLRATSIKRFAIAKSKLSKIVSEMDRRLDSEEGDDDKANDNTPSGFDDVTAEELQELFQTAGNEVVDAQKSLYESDRSTDRVNSHLLDYSVANGVQFRLSQAELERLDNMMEEHLANLPEDKHRPETRGDDGVYVYGSDEFDGDIDPMFGGRDTDEYVVKGLPNGESKWD